MSKIKRTTGPITIYKRYT